MEIVSETPYLIEVFKSFRYTFYFIMKYSSENVNKQTKTV